MFNPLAFAVSNIRVGLLYRHRYIFLSLNKKILKLLKIIRIEGCIMLYYIRKYKIKAYLRFIGVTPVIKKMAMESSPGRRVFMSFIKFERYFLKKRGIFCLFLISFFNGWISSNEFLPLLRNKRVGGEVLVQIILNGYTSVKNYEKFNNTFLWRHMKRSRRMKLLWGR